MSVVFKIEKNSPNLTKGEVVTLGGQDSIYKANIVVLRKQRSVQSLEGQPILSKTINKWLTSKLLFTYKESAILCKKFQLLTLSNRNEIMIVKIIIIIIIIIINSQQ